MRINSKYLKRLGGLTLATFTRQWMSTLDYRHAAYDPAVDPVHPRYPGPAIFLLWHEYIPFLFYLRGHCRISMLVSRHGDAEWLSCAARHMGFEIIRGSTNRGGATALRELMTSSARRNLAITPDGPRGPRRQLAPGPIYLASRTGLPLVAVGLGYSRCWRAPTWDRHAIPRPGARARGVTSPFLQIPPGLDRGGIEHYRQGVQRLLNQLTELAEQWAASGRRMEGELPGRRQPLPFCSAMRRPAGGTFASAAKGLAADGSGGDATGPDRPTLPMPQGSAVGAEPPQRDAG